MAIGMIATLKIQEGKNAEFEEVFLRLQAAVRENEPGNNFYALHRTDDPTTYVVMEQYADEEAMNAHGASDHFRSLGREMGAFMAGRPELQRLEAV